MGGMADVFISDERERRACAKMKPESETGRAAC
jgi:hypothetical protein